LTQCLIGNGRRHTEKSELYQQTHCIYIYLSSEQFILNLAEFRHKGSLFQQKKAILSKTKHSKKNDPLTNHFKNSFDYISQTEKFILPNLCLKITFSAEKNNFFKNWAFQKKKVILWLILWKTKHSNKLLRTFISKTKSHKTKSHKIHKFGLSIQKL